jgi:putative Mg2+ transporter-C (MgtC) family protein
LPNYEAAVAYVITARRSAAALTIRGLGPASDLTGVSLVLTMLFMLNELLAAGASFNVVPHIIALTIAYLLALPIGWDREREERSAGLRTFPLVAIASCGFVQAAETIVRGNPEATARVIEGIITGMGFIGGGAILRMKDSVRGTATAASLWATGAIGTAVGVGAYDIAFLISLVTIVTLKALTPLKQEPRGPDEQGANRQSGPER